MSNIADFFGGGNLKWWDEIYPNKIEITTSQDWTVPGDVTEVTVGICGGGGAGIDDNNGGGGGGSKMTYHTIDVTPGEIITVTIGAGGIYPSGHGGDSSFGSYLTVSGGKGWNATDQIYGDGGNGGACGGGASTYKMHQSESMVVEKIKNGRVERKQLFPINDQGCSRASGGCGGGYDYPGIGGSWTNPAVGYGAGGGQYAATNGDGTSGICVIWY